MSNVDHRLSYVRQHQTRQPNAGERQRIGWGTATSIHRVQVSCSQSLQAWLGCLVKPHNEQTAFLGYLVLHLTRLSSLTPPHTHT